MRKAFVVILVLFSLCIGLNARCTTIQDGLLQYPVGHYLQGQPLKVGFDPYGYNYQAYLFAGSYFNAVAGRYGFPPYEGDDAAYLAANPTVVNHWEWEYRRDTLVMKWNDAWLSNKDCDDDGLLDRPDDSYLGSGAWLTNHQSGNTKPSGAEIPHWTYFIKIVAVPRSAVHVEGKWYAADGTEIGPAIWGHFAIIQEVYSDPSFGAHGVLYKSPLNPGLGYYGKLP